MGAGTAIRAVVLGAAVCCALVVAWIGEVPLGLDFRGGLQVRYRIVAPAEADHTELADRALEVIRGRIDELDLGDASVLRRGQEIVVEVSGADADATARMRALLGRSVQLRFAEVDEGATLPDPPGGVLPDGLELRTDSLPSGPDQWVVASGPHARERLERYLATLPTPAGRGLLVGPTWSDDGPGQHPFRSYVVMADGGVGGDRVADAEVVLDEATAQPVVQIAFDAEGARVFGELTSRIVQRRLAIVLDGVVESAPVVQEAIRGGRARITMGVSTAAPEALREAQDLALLLRSGALPAPIELTAEDVVAPAVRRGSVAIGAAIAAALWLGLSILALWRYRAGGWAVAAAVPATVIFAAAAFASFGATLTVSSVAGIALGLVALLVSLGVSLEREREGRSFWPVSALTGAGVHAVALVMGIALLSVGAGPTRGLAAGLVLALPGAAFVSLVLALRVGPRGGHFSVARV